MEKEFSYGRNPSNAEINSFEWKDVWENYDSKGHNRNKLKSILMKLMEILNFYPGFLREVTVMRLLDSDIKKVVDDYEREDMNKIIDLIKSIDEIRIKDYETAAFIFYRTIDLIFYETVINFKSSRNKERTINEMTDMLYRYLFND